MKKLNIAYFGAPSFSAIFLEKLITDVSINQLIDIKLVITQPDRPVGRKQILTPTSVNIIAHKMNVPVYSFAGGERRGAPTSRTDKLVSEAGAGARQDPQIINVLRNIDLALVFAFGEIIPKELLDLPKYGFINIHPSLLPKYRGPSPIAYPLINGDAITGVTLIKMDEQIDHGPIIAQEKLDILPDDRRPDVEIKLTDLAFKMFKKLVDKAKMQAPVFYDLGRADPKLQSRGSRPTGVKNMASNLWPLPTIEQNHKLATYTKLLKKSAGFISFSVLKKVLNNQPISSKELPQIIRNLKLEIRNSPKIIFNYFRGLYPWPGLWTLLPNGKRLKITNLTMEQSNNLTIESVQLEGKKEVDFKTFNKAYKVITL